MSPTPASFDKDLLTRKQAAYYLSQQGCPVTARMLEKWAANGNSGKGPPFLRLRWKAVRYQRSDLDAWRRKQIVRVE